VVVGKTEYVNSYGFGKPFWNGRERSGFAVVGELKSNLKDLAQHHHAVAQKSKKLEDYTVAARWYGEYLNSFPDDPDSAETNFMLAEVLFESRQYTNAAREYERSAYAYPSGARPLRPGTPRWWPTRNRKKCCPPLSGQPGMRRPPNPGCALQTRSRSIRKQPAC
jgi:tetratricopeptide (TPR) repeat protein